MTVSSIPREPAWPRGVALAALLLSLVGAGCEPSTLLAIQFQTDLVPGVEFDELELEVDGQRWIERRVGDRDSFSRMTILAEREGIAPGRKTVRVTLGGRGNHIFRERVFELRDRRIVPIVIERSCRDVTCPGASDDPAAINCAGGRCVPSTCGEDGTAGCPAPACDAAHPCPSSGTACVEDTCVEGSCLALPRADACGDGELCIPGEGCLPRSGRGDAGTFDAGEAPLDAFTPGPECTRDDDCAGGVGCDVGRCVGGRCELRSRCDAGERCCGDVCATSCDTGPCAGRAAGYECRPAAGLCDLPELCDGVSPDCPADRLVALGTACRDARGDCDVAEACDGVSPSCPADHLVAPGTACRAARGDCDVAEVCDGSSPSCPADVRQPAGTVCRAARGTCDLQEVCTGTSDACPSDAYKPDGSLCRSPGLCLVNAECAGGVCVGESCPPGTSCRCGGACLGPREVCP